MSYLTDLNGFDKGSLAARALVSSITKLNPEADISSAEFYEFPSFVVCQLSGCSHILVTSFASVDVSPFISFALKQGSDAAVIYVAPNVLDRKYARSITQILNVLKIQSDGFLIQTKFVHLGREDNFNLAEHPKGELLTVVQDEVAASNFMDLPDAQKSIELLRSHDCQIAFIGNVALATFLGLEVARLSCAGSDVMLEIGVGRNDRLAKSMIAGSEDVSDTLSNTISVVKKYRLGNSAFHPLARLSLSRWMRLSVIRDPQLLNVSRLIPIELVRAADWPSEGIWSLNRVNVTESTQDDLLFREFEPSFTDDEMSFALAVHHDDSESVVGFYSEVHLGAVAKLYEVTQSCIDLGRKVMGSILVDQDKSRLISLERLVGNASFSLKTVTLDPNWKSLNPS